MGLFRAPPLRLSLAAVTVNYGASAGNGAEAKVTRKKSRRKEKKSKRRKENNTKRKTGKKEKT